MAIPIFTANITYFVILESPKFLYEKDIKKCVKVLN